MQSVKLTAEKERREETKYRRFRKGSKCKIYRCCLRVYYYTYILYIRMEYVLPCGRVAVEDISYTG